jgi:transposase
MNTETMLFSAALGLQLPWQVVDVRFDETAKELHLDLDFSPGSVFACPECGAARKAYDRNARTWRHLNFFEHKCYLHAGLPRVDCSACGIKVVDVPWARLGSGFTLLFDALIVTLCLQMTITAVGRMVGEHDTRLWRVLQAYVQEARQELDMSTVTKIGVDETSWKSNHQYITLFADLAERRVLFVTEGKDAQTVAAFRHDLAEHQGKPDQIETVCMDLSPAFQSGVSAHFPQADKTFDRFHVVKLANEAVDQIRRQEAKENDILKKTRYLWLSNKENLSDAKQKQLASIQAMNLATATAYQMKLNLQELWTLPTRDTAAVHLDAWYKWIMQSSIGTAMKKLANTVKAHASGILNFFPDRLTSGLMEGINSLVQAAKAKARGYRNTTYFKTIIYLIAGKLEFNLPT